MEEMKDFSSKEETMKLVVELEENKKAIDLSLIMIMTIIMVVTMKTEIKQTVEDFQIVKVEDKQIEEEVSQAGAK